MSAWQKFREIIKAKQNTVKPKPDFDPCPKCGGDVLYSHHKSSYGNLESVSVECESCGIKKYIDITEQQMRRFAMEQWNYLDKENEQEM